MKININEIKAFHGSQRDFDKFNHKKYISSGAGSQQFGYGTYVTDDEVIAKDYANVHDTGEHDYKRYVYINSIKYDNENTYDAVYEIYNWVRKNKQDIYAKALEITHGKDFESHAAYRMNCWLEDYLRKDIDDIEIKECIDDCENELHIYNTLDISDKVSCLLTLMFCYFIVNNEVLPYYKPKYKIVYEVEIPDDDGINYLHWHEPINEKQKCMIINGAKELKKRFPKMDIDNIIASYSIKNYKKTEFKYVYDGFSWDLNTQKAASLFLKYCGFVGIKYQTGSLWGLPDGAKENGMNYVIFDANDVKIINKKSVQK